MYSGLDPELDTYPAVYESDKTADMLKYVREIGALGGTLTLEYDAGQIELTGDELIQAAFDYDLTEPFTIVSDLPEELQEPIEPAPRVYLGHLGKIAAMAVPLALFALIGWSLI